MDTRDRLRMRALMLVDFKRQSSIDITLRRLLAEFGPGSVTREIVEKWFGRFHFSSSILDPNQAPEGLEEMVADAHRFAEFELLKCGDFLNSDGRTCFSFGSDAHEDRFFVVKVKDMKVVILDLFYMETREFEVEVSASIDCEPCGHTRSGDMSISQIVFVDRFSGVLGLSVCRNCRVFGVFHVDYLSSKILVSACTVVHYRSQITQITDGGRAFWVRYYSPNAAGERVQVCARVEIDGDQMKPTRVLQPPPLSDLHFLSNGKILSHVRMFFNRHMQMEYVEAENKMVKHPIKILPELAAYKSTHGEKTILLWGDKLFVTIPDPNPPHEKCKLFALDLLTLEFKFTGIEFPFVVDRLSVKDNEVLLVIKQCGPKERKFDRFYRVPLRYPEPLLNLSWFAIRRHGEHDPHFYEQVLRMMPKQSPIRCPFR